MKKILVSAQVMWNHLNLWNIFEKVLLGNFKSNFFFIGKKLVIVGIYLIDCKYCYICRFIKRALNGFWLDPIFVGFLNEFWCSAKNSKVDHN